MKPHREIAGGLDSVGRVPAEGDWVWRGVLGIQHLHYR